MTDYKYKKKENKFTENGHTMFEEDVLQKLKRLAYLEEQIKKGQLLPLHSDSLFSEMNTEILKISIAIQKAKESEFIEDYTFHKSTSKKDIRTFLNIIKQQNEKLVILNQRMIRLREQFCKNYR